MRLIMHAALLAAALAGAHLSGQTQAGGQEVQIPPQGTVADHTFELESRRAQEDAYRKYVRARPWERSFTIVKKSESYYDPISRDLTAENPRWVTTGWQWISQGPKHYVQRLKALTSENNEPSQDEREGWDGTGATRVFKISDTAKVRTERFAFTSEPEVEHRVRRDRDPDEKYHCLKIAASDETLPGSFIGETRLLDTLRVFAIEEPPHVQGGRSVVYYAPSLGCAEVQRETYVDGILRSRTILTEYNDTLDRSLFERPLSYKHVSPSEWTTAQYKYIYRNVPPEYDKQIKDQLASMLKYSNMEIADKIWAERRLPD
jgi:hypothetical protein